MLEQARSLGTDHAGLVATDAAAAAWRLLVIDDEDLHRTIICRVAAKAGYLPSGAASYEEAAKLARETAFDCITLDLSLGAHAGVEMLRHLAGLNFKAPIVIISGCDYAICRETLHVGKTLKLDILEAVPKPVDLAALRRSLEWLRRRPGRAALRAQRNGPSAQEGAETG